MKKAWSWLLVVCLLLSLLIPALAQDEGGEAKRAVEGYLSACTQGKMEAALPFVWEQDLLKARFSDPVMRLLGYPSLKSFAVKEVQQVGEAFHVRVACNAFDLSKTLLDNRMPESLLTALVRSDLGQSFADYESNREAQAEVWSVAAEHEEKIETVFVCTRVEGKVCVSLKATAENQSKGQKPFDLHCDSYGMMQEDHGTRFYDKGKFPYAWLRLYSTEKRFDLEGLRDFRVVSGKASCGTLPVNINSLGYEGFQWMTLHFTPINGRNIGALKLYLQEGETVQNVKLACTRRVNDYSFLFYEEEISLSLSDVQEKSLVKEGDVSAQVDSLKPFAPDIECLEYIRKNDPSVTLDSMIHYGDQPIFGVPEAALKKPWAESGYRLYILCGTVNKKSGLFGAYDLMFALRDAPEGVHLAPYSECELCGEIDSHDLVSGGIFLPEGLSNRGSFEEEVTQKQFNLLMLVDQKYPADQVQDLMRGLKLDITFSAEKWNFSYEQHGCTTGIGPRDTITADLSKVVLKADEPTTPWAR